MDDEISFIFNIPATDALGKTAVTGKFRALEEQVLLHWKFEDRTFNRDSNAMRTIEMTYDDLEEARVVKSGMLWFSKKVLTIRIRDPRLIEEVPGVTMGKLELELPARSVEPATKFVTMVEYRVSESVLKRRLGRLEDMGM